VTEVTDSASVRANGKISVSHRSPPGPLSREYYSKESHRIRRIVAVRLPKPIYESLPIFLIAVGIVFVVLVMKQYEYAPTLFSWLLGLFCIFAGIALLAVRIIYRMQHAAAKAEADAREEEYQQDSRDLDHQ